LRCFSRIEHLNRQECQDDNCLSDSSDDCAGNWKEGTFASLYQRNDFADHDIVLLFFTETLFEFVSGSEHDLSARPYVRAAGRRQALRVF
jgi:hypothetical protein